MDEKSSTIRFGIAPGTSARRSEQEHRAAGPGASMRIAGGTSARRAEAEGRTETQRPYGVSMQARTGKACSMEDLMAAEAAAEGRYGQRAAARMQPSEATVVDRVGVRAQDSVQRATFQPVAERPVANNDQISASAGDAPLYGVGPDGTKEEARTVSRSPFQALRSLLMRHAGTERHDKKASYETDEDL
jgi:hypothetical protein